MRDFPDLPDFLRRKPNDGVIDVNFMKTRDKPMVNPNPLYSGGKYLGSYFDYKDGTFSAYLPDGKSKSFNSKDEAMAWLAAGREVDAAEIVPVKKKAEPVKPHPVAAAPEKKPAKPPRPVKVESPAVEEAKLKFKSMKVPEIETWGRKIGAKWEPVAPNPGVYRMRVQNAILAVLRK